MAIVANINKTIKNNTTMKYPKHITPEQAERLIELREAIEGLCLGSVETVVIEAAQNELLNNWYDHNKNEDS